MNVPSGQSLASDPFETTWAKATGIREAPQEFLLYIPSNRPDYNDVQQLQLQLEETSSSSRALAQVSVLLGDIDLIIIILHVIILIHFS